jgi:hypothetical protein
MKAEQLDNSQQINLHIFMPRTVPRWKNYLILCKTGPIFPLRCRPGSNHVQKGASPRGKDAFSQKQREIKIWGCLLKMPCLCACEVLELGEASASPVIDRWVSPDATHTPHGTIDSLRPKLGARRGCGQQSSDLLSDFRSEMLLWRGSQTKCRNPRSGVRLATRQRANNGLALWDAWLASQPLEGPTTLKLNCGSLGGRPLAWRTCGKTIGLDIAVEGTNGVFRTKFWVSFCLANLCKRKLGFSLL